MNKIASLIALIVAKKGENFAAEEEKKENLKMNFCKIGQFTPLNIKK
jgi:hypothetical protein